MRRIQINKLRSELQNHDGRTSRNLYSNMGIKDTGSIKNSIHDCALQYTSKKNLARYGKGANIYGLAIAFMIWTRCYGDSNQMLPGS